ncbi:hypothetical protein SMRU11_29440 [Sinorhizobium meliloti RU11/001]|nr:hypothetical protein SMRU11_29440 [Sinorhizobium meliloti RU11/001]
MNGTIADKPIRPFDRVMQLEGTVLRVDFDVARIWQIALIQTRARQPSWTASKKDCRPLGRRGLEFRDHQITTSAENG